jgi:hypothetical protein
MRKQASATPKHPKPLPSKRDELLVAIKQRNELWALLDNIDTLDDATREHDGKFRELTRRQLKKRFDIYNPG